MPLGAGGGYDVIMNYFVASPNFLCSKKVFDVARVLAGIWVFLCHSFYMVHYWFGFFSVVIFFFISGYGMEFTSSRSRALVRLPRFLFVLLFFAVLYRIGAGVWYYPTAWYIIAYSSIMVLYRFLGRSSIVFFFSFFVYMYLFLFAGFEYSWWICPFGFLFGYFTFRSRSFFSWSSSFLMFFMGFLSFYLGQMIFIVLWIPLVLRLFLIFSSLPFLSFLSRFSVLVFPFFSLHCWFLAFFGSTWTLGGSSSVLGCLASFLLSLAGAFLLYRYVPIFTKKKFWIIQ